MHPCSQDSRSTADDHHTRRGARRGTSHHGLSIKGKLVLSSLPFFTNLLIYLLNIFPGKRKRPPSNCSKKKKKREAVFHSLILLDSPSFLEDSGGHRDGQLWYGLQNFCYVQGRGDWELSLTWQPKESLELHLHSKSPYSAHYHTWERKR